MRNISFVFLPILLISVSLTPTHDITLTPEEKPLREGVGGQIELIQQCEWDTDIAYAVMMAESHGKPEAYNPEWHNGCQGSFGSFQIACVHEPNPEVLFDEEYNIRRACEIWREQGWLPWGAYTDKSFLVFLH